MPHTVTTVIFLTYDVCVKLNAVDFGFRAGEKKRSFCTKKSDVKSTRETKGDEVRLSHIVNLLPFS